MKSRRAILVKPGKFELDEVSVTAGPGQVLVKTEGCGLCNWELNHWLGHIWPCPQALGHEGYGTVAEVGPGVSDAIKPGMRVTGLGSECFADYFVIPEAGIMALKPGLDQKHVPGEPLYCVVNVLRTAQPSVGDCVAVVGCGPMGLWAIQGLAARTLQCLIAIDIDPAKLALASRFGATHTINSSVTDAVEAVRAITAGHMIDVAVEGTGGPGVNLCIGLLRPNNPRLIIMSSFKKALEVDMVGMVDKSIDMIVAHPGRSVREKPEITRRTAVLINNGIFKTDVLISHTFPLARINDAFTALEKKPAGFLKGVVVP
jgi:threonine dehydrogenase-like Zn-dependent dehydrogenase